MRVRLVRVYEFMKIGCEVGFILTRNVIWLPAGKPMKYQVRRDD
jgi:hypothetical protein